MKSGGPITTMWWALAFIAAAGALGLAFSKNDLWTSEVPAAWAQAIGSLAALVAIWWSTNAALRHNRTNEARAEYRRAVIAYKVSDELCQLVEAAEAALAKGPPFVFQPTDFDGILPALEQIDINGLPSSDLAWAILVQRRVARFYPARFKEAVDAILTQRQIASDVSAALRELSDGQAKAHRTIILERDAYAKAHDVAQAREGD